MPLLMGGCGKYPFLLYGQEEKLQKFILTKSSWNGGP